MNVNPVVRNTRSLVFGITGDGGSMIKSEALPENPGKDSRIVIAGAREKNLKNVSVSLPQEKYHCGSRPWRDAETRGRR